MNQVFLNTDDIEKWQPRFEKLIARLGPSNDELRKILENAQSLLTFQVPGCCCRQDERKEANKSINALLKSVEEILDPSFLFPLPSILVTAVDYVLDNSRKREKLVKENFEKLGMLISSTSATE